MVALADTKDTSNTTPVALDQIERKRQRERERYAGMSAEQKEEKNKKRREARLMKKNVQAQCNENKHPGVEDKILATGVETDISPSTADETADWLQRNDSYAQEFSRSIDVPEGYQGTDTTLGDMTVNTTSTSHILDVYQGTIDNMGEDDSIPSKDPRTVPQDFDSFRQPNMHHGMEACLGLSMGPICSRFN